MEPATFRLVAQCLNQMRHRTYILHTQYVIQIDLIRNWMWGRLKLTGRGQGSGTHGSKISDLIKEGNFEHMKECQLITKSCVTWN
jgi:hypothetical protein